MFKLQVHCDTLHCCFHLIFTCMFFVTEYLVLPDDLASTSNRPELYSEPSQTPNMELFVKMVNEQ